MARQSALDEQVTAVMEGTRVLIAVAAHSLAELESSLTVPQFRVMVMIQRQGEVNISGVASALGVHLSSAARTCARLVDEGLLDRREDEYDRRNLILSLSDRGESFLAAVTENRRAALRRLLKRMPAQRRSELAAAMRQLSEDAGDTPDQQATFFGWIH